MFTSRLARRQECAPRAFVRHIAPSAGVREVASVRTAIAERVRRSSLQSARATPVDHTERVRLITQRGGPPFTQRPRPGLSALHGSQRGHSNLHRARPALSAHPAPAHGVTRPVSSVTRPVSVRLRTAEPRRHAPAAHHTGAARSTGESGGTVHMCSRTTAGDHVLPVEH